MKTVICDAFSMEMITHYVTDLIVDVRIEPISQYEAFVLLDTSKTGIHSYIEDKDVCSRFTELLGFIIPIKTTDVKLGFDDTIVVGQLTNRSAVENSNGTLEPEYIWLRIRLK